jgi:hypothetical protein
MSHETSLTREESQVEALLGQFQPLVNTQTRDRLMFKAGRASAGHVHLWQGVSGVFVMLLVCSLTIRMAPLKTAPSITTTPVASNQWQMPPEASTPRPMNPQAYINVRYRVLEQGLDALPDVRGGRAVAADRMGYGKVLRKYMAL